MTWPGHASSTVLRDSKPRPGRAKTQGVDARRGFADYHSEADALIISIEDESRTVRAEQLERPDRRDRRERSQLVGDDPHRDRCKILKEGIQK